MGILESAVGKDRTLLRERLRKLFLFGVVGGFGTLLNTTLLYTLTRFAGLHYLFAAAIATEIAIVSNFFGNNLFTFRHDAKGSPLWRKFLSFQSISLVTLVGTLLILYLLTTSFGETYLLVWNLIAILTMFFANFVLNRKFTWKDDTAARVGRASTKRMRRGKLSFLRFSFFFVVALSFVALAHPAHGAAETNVTTIGTILNVSAPSNVSDLSPLQVTTGPNATANTTLANSTSPTTSAAITTSGTTNDTATNGTGTNATTPNQPSSNQTSGNQAPSNQTPISPIPFNQTSGNVSSTTNQTNQTTNGSGTATTALPAIKVAAPSKAAAALGASQINLTVFVASQLGYHPSSHKQAILYSDATSGTFTVRNAATNAAAFNGALVKALDSNNIPVECQGGLPCLIADFSALTAEGNYYVQTNTGATTGVFPISSTVFSDNVGLFGEFFAATKQQGSPYHADLHGNGFPYMADGSFIMESDQASLTLIRLASAYRRDPAIFTAADRNTIKGYADYLASLQGVQVTPDANGVRLNEGMQISNVFYPGPVPGNITTMDVYNPGTNATVAQAGVPVTSLCGASDGTKQWQTCMDTAAAYYKCQADEPCLNLSYVGPRGSIASNVNGFGVSRGWYYEFGCYNDVLLNQAEFTSSPDPCQVFYPDNNRDYTVHALLAFTEAIPAIYDLSPASAQALFTRSVNTYQYVKSTYGTSFGASDPSAAFYGASLFLLYDYSGDVTYLQEAAALGQNGNVDEFFGSANTEGQAYYWEEYARHRAQIEGAGITYLIGGIDPSEYFRGAMFKEYNGQGLFSIDQSGERVFQLYRNSGFQNSREMLSVAVLSAKASELNPGSEQFIPLIADTQLAWLTGMNLVQDGVAVNPPLVSRSFIFGIGTNPQQFHSRLLIDSGYFTSSGGSVLGTRGMGYQFKPNSSAYVYFDGVSTILGKTYGALGNGFNGEAQLPSPPFVGDQTFLNGQTTIPGWIDGAFDTIPQNGGDNDVIYNFGDNRNTYEFTETTNEMVATAVELFAYLDGRDNNRSRHASVSFGSQGNVTPPVAVNATLSVSTAPSGATITLNATTIGVTTNGTLVTSVAAGAYTFMATKTGYVAVTQQVNLVANQTTTLNITLQQALFDATLSVSTTPSGVSIALNGTAIGVTTSGTLLANVSAGSYILTATKAGYATLTQGSVLAANTTTFVNLTLQPTNSSITGNGTNVSFATNSSTGATYHLFETDTGMFWVTLNQASTVTWLVDGIPVTTTTGTAHAFNWTPGILAVPVAPLFLNTKQSIITARTVSGNGSSNVSSDMSWSVDVENVLNPFFTDVFGAPDAVVHVFTNNKAVSFSALNVTLDNGGALTTYALDPFVGGNETDWKTQLTNLPFGNTYIRTITGYVNATHTTQVYTLGSQRAHYRTPPPESGGGGSGGGGGGGGGGGFIGPDTETLELVYVTLGSDVLNQSGTESITLDAKTSDSEIKRVVAVFRTPSGTGWRKELSLISGDSGYGTWSANLSGLVVGKYLLAEIDLFGASANATIVPITDRSFYVTGPELGAAVGPPQALIYFLLSPSVITNGTEATLRLDASDPVGVTAVFATVENTRDTTTFQVALRRVSGTAQYGTWEGTFAGSEPDTTYTVTHVDVESAAGTKTYPLSDRSVYVNAVPQTGRNGITGAVAGIAAFSGAWYAKMLAAPLIPVFIGFGLMLLILGAFFVNYRFGQQSKKQ